MTRRVAYRGVLQCLLFYLLESQSRCARLCMVMDPFVVLLTYTTTPQLVMCNVLQLAHGMQQKPDSQAAGTGRSPHGRANKDAHGYCTDLLTGADSRKAHETHWRRQRRAL